jgi:probable F420-dependent oxidoreductase
MRLGFGAPVTGSWVTPGIMTEIAGRAEELGYASLWTFQRVLFPDGTGLSDTYRSVLDPLTSLAFLAACTHRIRLAVGVVNLPFLSPILLAKQAAAVDVLSAGRLVLGLGLGWAEEEFTATGGSLERRGARAEEYIRCLKEIFTGQVDFEGEFYRIPRSDVLPRPLQDPHPPIILGGIAPAALERAGRIADGWISFSRADLTRIGDSVRIIRGAAEKAGRDPAAVEIIVRGLVQLSAADGSPAATANRTPLTGSAEQIRDDLASLEAQGVDEVFLDLNFDPRVAERNAEPVASVDLAHEVLDAFAPTR